MPTFRAHELGIVYKEEENGELRVIIDRTKAKYFGRPLADAAWGSTAHRKFENVVKLSFAPMKTSILYRV